MGEPDIFRHLIFYCEVLHTYRSISVCLLDNSLRVKIEIYCRCQMRPVAPCLLPSLSISLSLSIPSPLSQSHLSAVNPISCHSDLLTASRLQGTCFTPGIFMQTQTSQHQALTNHSISQSNRTRLRVPATRSRDRATNPATLQLLWRQRNQVLNRNKT